jgi:hypothetical protein
MDTLSIAYDVGIMVTASVPLTPENVWTTLMLLSSTSTELMCFIP